MRTFYGLVALATGPVQDHWTGHLVLGVLFQGLVEVSFWPFCGLAALSCSAFLGYSTSDLRDLQHLSLWGVWRGYFDAILWISCACYWPITGPVERSLSSGSAFWGQVEVCLWPFCGLAALSCSASLGHSTGHLSDLQSLDIWGLVAWLCFLLTDFRTM